MKWLSATKPSIPADLPSDDESGQVVYSLKKRRPGCTGMFWRPDPTAGGAKLASNNHWPRDGAKLRGSVVEVDNEKWLLCSAVLQKGSSSWEMAPGGAAIPFEYDNHYYLE